METAKRDQKLDALRKELDLRRDLMLSKARELENAQKDNKYLAGIADDYARYYQGVKEDRIRQKETLQALSSYISNYSQGLEETDALLAESRTQQQEIMDEISRLRREIDSMI